MQNKFGGCTVLARAIMYLSGSSKFVARLVVPCEEVAAKGNEARNRYTLHADHLAPVEGTQRAPIPQLSLNGATVANEHQRGDGALDSGGSTPVGMFEGRVIGLALWLSFLSTPLVTKAVPELRLIVL